MKIILILGIVMILFTYISCQSKVSVKNNTDSVMKNVDVSEFDALVLNNNTIIIDVRTPNEIAQGKIPNALEIDVNSGHFEQEINKLSKDNTYLVYCRSGRRSVAACKIMEQQGFSKLVNLKGGYNAWSKTHK